MGRGGRALVGDAPMRANTARSLAEGLVSGPERSHLLRAADLLSKRGATRREGIVILENQAAHLLQAGNKSPLLQHYRKRWERVLDEMPGRSALQRRWESMRGQVPWQMARWAEAVSDMGEGSPAWSALREHLGEISLEDPPGSEEQARQLCLIEGTKAIEEDPYLQRIERGLREAEGNIRSSASLGGSDSPLLMLPHSGWDHGEGYMQPTYPSSSAGSYSTAHDLALVFAKGSEGLLGGDEAASVHYAARHELIHSQQPLDFSWIASDKDYGTAIEITEGITEMLNRALGETVQHPPYDKEVRIARHILGDLSLDELRDVNRHGVRGMGRDIFSKWRSLRPGRGPGGHYDPLG